MAMGIKVTKCYSFWETCSGSASQEITRSLCNPEVHYRVGESLPLCLVLSHMNPVHTLTTYFIKIHFNNILTFTPRSGFPSKIRYEFLVCPMLPTIPAYTILFTFIILMVKWGIFLGGGTTYN
jgi:hypothetical protein